MPSRDELFLQQLRATFQVEAREHIETIANGVIALETRPGDAGSPAVVETIFRAAHSLKGAARAVDLPAIETLCGSLEDLFAAWKRGGLGSRDELDSVHRTLEAIAAILAREHSAPATQARPLAPPADATDGTRMDRPAPAAPSVAPKPAPPPVSVDAHETVRVSVRKLREQLQDSEELLTVKLAAAQRVTDLQDLGRRVSAWRDAWAAAEGDVRSARLAVRAAADQRTPGHDAPTLRLLDFVESGFHALRSIVEAIAAFRRTAARDRHVAARLTDELLEESKKLLLLPFATISAAFPKLVRDLSREQGKDVDFSIRGDEVEIDRRILDEIKDPVIHLLRNSIDHGVEPPEQRQRAGKAARAAVTLIVSRVNGSKVEIRLEDDGAGIDAKKVREAALARGAIAAAEAERMSDEQARTLIFESDVSTRATVSRVSGRGLGLAIVREKVEKLGGRVSVESAPGRGSAFVLVMPATVATFRGVLVEAAGQVLVLPALQVERVTRVRREDVKSVENRSTFVFDGRSVALVQLAEVLEMSGAGRAAAQAATLSVVVLASGDQRIAFAVDDVLGEQELLLKPLCKPLVRIRNVSAATVLGSGRIAPLLNVADLFASARKTPGARPRTAEPADAARSKSVLVAEDSITSRMLLTSILESAGYAVSAAVDGLDAMTRLRAGHFDLVVSDVEMPRLNGIDLTARIRADSRLAGLPVILVTALGTREDRERGVNAGANAYIVKSSFDQNDLLAAVRRLI